METSSNNSNKAKKINRILFIKTSPLCYFGAT